MSDSLKRLALSKNDRVDIRPIAHLASLQAIDLSQNSIASLPDAFAELKNLHFLDISGNRVTSMNGLKALSQLNNLSSINLSGNPICNTIGYPAPLFSANPSVTWIDGLTREFV